MGTKNVMWLILSVLVVAACSSQPDVDIEATVEARLEQERHKEQESEVDIEATVEAPVQQETEKKPTSVPTSTSQQASKLVPTLIPTETPTETVNISSQLFLYSLEELSSAGFLNEEDTTEIYGYDNLVEAWKGTMVGLGETTDLDILLFDGAIHPEVKEELKAFAILFGGSEAKIKFAEPNLVILCDPEEVCSELYDSLPEPSSDRLVRSMPVPLSTPTPIPTTTRTVDTSGWVSATNQTQTMSISIPPNWKVVNDTALLSSIYAQIDALGIAPILTALDEQTGSNLLILADVRELFELEPAPIDLETYVGTQIEDLMSSLGISDEAVEGEWVEVDGIKGILLTATRGTGTMYMAILIGPEPRMICGSMPVIVQIVGASTDPIPEKIISTFRIHANAAFTEGCTDRRALSFIDESTPTPTPSPTPTPTAVPTPTPTMLPTKTPTPESAAVEGVIFRPGPGETTTDRTPSIEIDFSRLGIEPGFGKLYPEVGFTKAVLTNDEGSVDVLPSLVTTNNMNFYYRPTTDLDLGQYTLTITATRPSGATIGPLSTVFHIVTALPTFTPPATNSPTPTKTPVPGYLVTVRNYSFSHPNLTVLPGETVTWDFVGGLHSVTSLNSGGFDSGVKSNGTYSKTFSTPGVFDYVCSLHGSMTGTITVMGTPVPTPTPTP